MTTGEIQTWLDGRSFGDLKNQYDRDGYIIFPSVLSANDVKTIREALHPHLNHFGRNNFEGFKSNRVYSLLAKNPDVFSRLVVHPLSLAFVEADLGRTCLLSSLLAINLHPGESVQDWHFDDQHINVPRPRVPFGVSTFWAIDDMTDVNGATELIPGSHKWSDAEGFDHPDFQAPEPADNQNDPQPHPDALKVIMPAGSLMIAKGTLWHRGGANRSEKSRLIITPQYCPGWARQLENILLGTPKDVAVNLPDRVQELIGYNIHGAFMGYVDGVHPKRFLKESVS